MLSRQFVESRPNQIWEKIGLQAATDELLKCADSFLYFVETFVYIQDKEEQSWIRFSLWAAQKAVAVELQGYSRVVILKARQLGLSWLVVAYAVWHMIFDPIAEIIAFSKTEREAKDLLERAKGIYNRLPAWMQCAGALINKATTWKLSNGSRFQVLPRTGGDSYAATLIIFDEADHVEDFAKMYSRAKPAVGKTGKIFIISTSNKDKPASLYKTIFTKAFTGHTSTRAVFIPYYAHPERDAAWYEQEHANYFEEFGSYDEFEAHYPATPEQALKARTLNKFFPPHWLQAAYDNPKPLYVVGRAGYPDAPPQVPNFTGLIIYDMPEAGRQYLVGVDTAEGGKNSNETAITVLDARHFVEVAHLSGLIDATSTGRIASELAVFYNDALLNIERNNHGHTVIAEALRLGKARLFINKDKKYGWLSNSVGKPVMYNYAYDALRAGRCIVRTSKTMIQLQSIERATLRAPENLLDDAADSFVLAVTAGLEMETGGAWSELLEF